MFDLKLTLTTIQLRQDRVNKQRPSGPPQRAARDNHHGVVVVVGPRLTLASGHSSHKSFQNASHGTDGELVQVLHELRLDTAK